MSKDSSQPQGGPPKSADGSIMADILAAADSPEALSQHQVYVEHMVGAIRGNRPVGLSILEMNDRQGAVADWIRAHTGRSLGYAPVWLRIIRPDLGRGALFLVDNLHVCREVELTVVAEPGVISRPVIRDVCRWAFRGLRLDRVVVRIPADRPDLSSLAGRARFQFEGTARGFYGGDRDAHVWAMTAARCPWLPPLLAETSLGEVSLPANAKVH